MYEIGTGMTIEGKDRSCRAPGDQRAPLANDVVDQRARHVSPLVDVVLADEDQVDGYAQAAKRTPQADELGAAIEDAALDHQEVEIRTGPPVTLRVRGHCRRDATADVLNHSF